MSGWTEPKECDPALGTGVEVRVTELDRTYRSLEPYEKYLTGVAESDTEGGDE
jgi:hypothetical protein